MNNKLLNLEYGSIHFTYWAVFAAISSFSSVLLLGRGYTNSEIGVIVAISNILSVLIQPFTADLADRSKRISLVGISQIMTLFMMGLTGLLLIFRGAGPLVFVIYAVILGVHASLQPLYNSLNFKLEECGANMNFGMCRCGGSLGYSILCLILGSVVKQHGSEVLPGLDLVFMAAIVLTVWLTWLQYEKIRANNVNVKKEWEEEKEDINLVDFVRRNGLFFVLNIGVFFLYIHNQVLNIFMLQVVQDVGGDSVDMGRVLSLMAFLEIPTMFCFDWINRKFSTSFLLNVSAVGFTAKIGLVFLSRSVTGILLAHILQLVSYALFLPAMVKYTNEVMSRGEAVKGQSLFTIMATVSGIAASFFGGFILDHGGARMLTGVSTLAAAIGTVILFLTVDRIIEKKKRGTQL